MLIRGKYIKPVFPIEYNLLMTLKYKEHEKKAITNFKLRTVSEFSYFRYEIIVESIIHNRTIQFDIHGLRAPQVAIPSSGPAIFTTEIETVNGRYTLIITKSNKKENRFTINIKKNNIIVEESPENKFVEIIANET